MTDPTENMWIKLGCLQMDVFEANSEAYMNLLITGLTQKVIMLMCYFVSVRMKLILPMEQLPESEKRELWERAKEIASGRLDHNQTIELSKCLYTISCFLKG